MTMDARAHLDAGTCSRTLRSSVRKSVARNVALGIGVSVAAAVAGGAVATRFAGLGPQHALVTALVMISAGAVVCAASALFAAWRIAATAGRLLEPLFEHPDIAEGFSTEALHFGEGVALSGKQAREDVETLRRMIRRSARKSSSLTAKLDEAVAAATAQQDVKEQFLGKMSHDLRTPLNAILGYATLLHEDAAAAGNVSAAADLERVLAGARQLLALINDMLGCAKIDSGSSIVDRQVIDIAELAQSIASGSDGRPDVHLHIDSDVGIMIGDASKMRQCLLNLLAAASKGAADGSTSLAITHAVSAAGASLCFTVEGVRAAASSSNSTELDLGLAVARRLARLMGGNCTIEELGDGTTSFRLIVPLTPDVPEALNESTTSDQMRPANEREKCALVVDDDEAALELMRRWLQEMGYEVMVALDGETGLKLARENRPNLILLDGLLPGRSGYEILAELRRDPLVGRTPVIFVTVDDDRCRGIECGASDYLRKPLTQDHLRAVLDVYAGTSAGDILIIEDDDDAAELVRRGVEEVGFSTRRARNGVEGIDMATAEPPSAIVLDVRMPKLDGFGVIEALARVSALNNIPIVVVSGHDMGLAEHQRLAGSARRVFTKGIVTPREIAQSLQELVA